MEGFVTIILLMWLVVWEQISLLVSSVQSEQKTASELRNGTDIIMQLIDINCLNKYKENWASADVPIRVNVKDIRR